MKALQENWITGHTLLYVEIILLFIRGTPFSYLIFLDWNLIGLPSALTVAVCCFTSRRLPNLSDLGHAVRGSSDVFFFFYRNEK
jgi:hypothetical protein